MHAMETGVLQRRHREHGRGDRKKVSNIVHITSQQLDSPAQDGGSQNSSKQGGGRGSEATPLTEELLKIDDCRGKESHSPLGTRLTVGSPCPSEWPHAYAHM